MRIELKPWNKSRVGNVILFVMLTLFFGYASIIIFGTLLSGDKEFRDWPYLLSPLIAAVFAWLLCITLSPKHQSCMDAVKGEMTFWELKKRVESEQPEHESLSLYFELANGKKFVTGGFASEHLDEVKKMV